VKKERKKKKEKKRKKERKNSLSKKKKSPVSLSLWPEVEQTGNKTCMGRNCVFRCETLSVLN